MLNRKRPVGEGNRYLTVMKPFLIALLPLLLAMPADAQDKKLVTRIAVLTIDASKLKLYMQLLQEQMQTAVRVEPGVISYQVYADKINPAKLTIVEVYANNKAYLAHREAPHFIKYKTATATMVKSLELSEVDPVINAKKNQPR